jgi:hypothetical protein
MTRLTNKALKDAIRTKYAWPGGYEIFGICDDGGILCCDCMRAEYKQIAWSRKHGVSDGWKVIGVDAACNYDSHTACDHCNKVIVEGEEEQQPQGE